MLVVEDEFVSLLLGKTMRMRGMVLKYRQRLDNLRRRRRRSWSQWSLQLATTGFANCRTIFQLRNPQKEVCFEAFEVRPCSTFHSSLSELTGIGLNAFEQ